MEKSKRFSKAESNQRLNFGVKNNDEHCFQALSEKKP